MKCKGTEQSDVGGMVASAPWAVGSTAADSGQNGACGNWSRCGGKTRVRPC